jgi:hypothetical protein
MGSRDSMHFYDGATLGALARAFSQSWATTKSRNHPRSGVRDHELSNALADKLPGLGDQGLNDPAELERVTLGSFPVDTDKAEWARRSKAGWFKSIALITFQQIKVW